MSVLDLSDNTNSFRKLFTFFATWLLWVIANGLGFPIALILAGIAALFPGVLIGFLFILNDAIKFYLLGILTGSVFGAIMGAFQGFVLHLHVQIFKQWLLATAISSAIAVAIMVTLVVLRDEAHLLIENEVFYAIFLGSFCALVFTTQWQTLRGKINFIVPWIPTNIVGVLIGSLVIRYFSLGVSSEVILPTLQDIKAWFMGGIVYGIITGVCLWWFIPAKKPHNPGRSG